MRTDGTPTVQNNNVKTVAIGDVQRDPNTQAPATPPSLRNPGEALPQDDPNTRVGQGTNRPVQFPKQKPDDHPDATNLPRDHKPAEAGQADDDSDESQPAQSDESQPAQQQQPPSKPN